MSRHKVEICGVNTANIKVLTTEETLDLFNKMKNGDPFAREDLIKGNLKLFLSVIKTVLNFPPKYYTKLYSDQYYIEKSNSSPFVLTLDIIHLTKFLPV